MAGVGSQLSARFSLPTLSDRIYRRSRLIGLIEAGHRQGAVVWVDGPAGSGKTTLGATYVAGQEPPALWYRLNVEDSEPGVFFSQLTALLPDQGSDPGRVPVYDGRVAVDPKRFAFRFFRALAAQIPLGHTLVFDDYHEVDSASPLHEIFAVLVDELAPGRQVLIFSREAPPPPIVSRVPGGRVIRVGWESLRLDEEETAEIARRLLPGKRPPRADARRLHQRVQGWAAGLILLLQQAAAGGSAAGLPQQATPDTINEFFSAEVGRLGREEDPGALANLALFPLFSLEMADRLLPETDVAELLERLYSRNFFLSRQERDRPLYSFHPLLREYLLKWLASQLGQEQFRSRQRAAAAVLEARDYSGEALDLYLQAGAWRESEALFLKLVPTLGRLGAYRRIAAYLARLPDALLEASPWLLYWWGASRWMSGEPPARNHIERAWRLFAEQGDEQGMIISWCTLVESLVLDWGNLHPIDDWLAVHPRLAEGLAAAPPEIRERAALALFMAYVYRRPQAPEMEDLAQSAHDLFIRSQDLLLKVMSGNQLTFFYAFMRGDLPKAAAYAHEISVLSEGAEPIAQIVSHANRSLMAFWMEGDGVQARQLIETGIRLAREAGIHFWDYMLNAIGAWVSISCGRYEDAGNYVEALGRNLQHESLINRCVFHDTQAILHLHLGQVALADPHSELSLELARKGGMPYAEAASLMTRSRVRSLQRDYEAAAVLRAAARKIGDAMDNAFVRFHLGIFEALERLDRFGIGDRETENVLRAALKFAAEGRFNGHLWVDRPSLTRLCHEGLARNIEPDYLRGVVARHSLSAESQIWALDGWPFFLRINLLSGLEVRRLQGGGYESVPLTGRAAQLLETLVWEGAQRVDQQYLTDLLWPDADGDAARRNFDTTLHRLRRQLGDDRLLVLSEGRLSLDMSLCSTDVAVLRQSMKHLESLVERDTDRTRLLGVQAVVLKQLEGIRHQAVTNVYNRPPARLIAELRPKLRRLATHWLQSQVPEHAIAPLEASIRLDPLAETSYRLLMESHLRQRQPGEALAVYVRCREMLLHLLGTRPGKELEDLRRQALEAG